MTETNTSPIVAPPSAPKADLFKRGKKMILGIGAVVLVGAVVALSVNQISISLRLGEDEFMMQGLGMRVNDLNKKLEDSAAIPLIPTASEKSPTKTSNDATAASSSANLTHLQSNLAVLSANLDRVEDEAKQADAHATHAQQMTQTSIATALAFIPVYTAALSGQGFGPELSALRAVGKNDAVFQDLLNLLEPYAAQGVPTISALREELAEQKSAVLQALDENTASDMGHKILFALKNLISIRPLHGGGGDIFSAMESALAKNDLQAALDALKTMPPQAQQALKDWKTHADSRQKINEKLRAIAEHLAATKTQNPP